MKNKTEPLAIVGIGLRLPGGINSPESFWKALTAGKDLITEVPPDRWDLKSFFDQDRTRIGKVYTRKGGFLNDISGFDPEFFGISPYEAGFMDPQQRLMLEVTWEALEDGGLAPEKLAGTKTGVFVGASLHEYENLNFDRNDHRLYGTYSATGIGMSILANRISYVFDFKGPSIAIDTACSSSLVAVHLACQSILAGETDIGIAGGIQILIRPDSTMTLCKGGFLSPEGCCRSFDAGANGYVRAEGAGVVVIKRLSSAIKDKNPIYALICGSAVNQDGKSAGLTIPDENAQKRVIIEALDKAGIQAYDVQYVEAHGTGTPVGDPVEARSIGAVLSQKRSKEDTLIIGSAKSNLGHTESAAGIVGLVKATLMLKHQNIPPNLHFVEPNPHIPFAELKIRVPTTLESWPDVGMKPRVAGVNSFGFGGTNAHVVLQEFQQDPGCEGNPESIESNSTQAKKSILIPVSARSEEALKIVAADMAEFLDDDLRGKNAEFVDIAASAALHKGHHPFRLALVASTKKELSESLQAYISAEERPDVIHGRVLQKTPLKLAVVFSGMGQQWREMGRLLYGHEPIFRSVIDQCSELFYVHTQSWTLLEELFASEEISRIDETHISQPCIFAVQAALSSLWQAWGIKPDVIVGHSVGEVAGYFAAGVLSLQDAVKVCFHRSRLQQTKAGSGKMLAVGLSEKAINQYIDRFEGKVSVAAVNAAESLTLAGDIEPLQQIAQECEKASIFHRFLNVEVPYHSASMDSIRDELRKSLSDIKPEKGLIPVISTVTGIGISGTLIDGDYWAENIRKPVLFKTALDHLLQMEIDIFVEVSAHPVLSAYMLESLEIAGKKGVIVHSLKRGENDETTLLRAVAKIYTVGYPVAWKTLSPAHASLVKLPAYPWQKKHCWLESEESRKYRLGIRSGHPLLGERMDTDRVVWNTAIDLSRYQYLRDHVVQGGIVFPAAAYLEMAFAACKDISKENGAVLEDIAMMKPLLFNPEIETYLQMTVEDGEKFSIFSRPKEEGADWTLHARGRFSSTDMTQTILEAKFEKLRERCDNKIDPNVLYAEFQKKGLVYGKTFQGVEELWIGDDEALGRINSGSLKDSDMDGYNIHPSVLDACFQVMGAFGGEGTYLPLRFEKAMLHSNPGKMVFCHARLTEKTKKWLTGNLAIYSSDGNLLLELTGFKCQRMLDQEDVSNKNLNEMLYEFEWKMDEECFYEGVPLNHYLPDVRRLKNELHSSLLELSETNNRKTRFAKVFPQLNELCINYNHEVWRNLMNQNPAWRCELAMIEKIDLLSLSFGKNSQTFEHFFNDSPTFRFGNKAVKLVVQAILKNLPEGHMVRILEIGAGTGGLTSTILPLLPQHRTQYWFTDVSDEVLNQAKSKFLTNDFVEFKTFDLQKKPEEQEFPLKAFDLVISSMVFDNVLDIHRAIDSIYRITADGGLFLLLESAGDCWYKFIQRKSENIDWTDVLKSNGFAEAESVFPAEGGNPCGLQITVAKKAQNIPIEHAILPDLPARGRGIETTEDPGYYVLLADTTGLAENLADLLTKSRMTDMRLIYQGESFDTSNPTKLVINPLLIDNYNEMLKFVWKDKTRAMTIVNLWNIENPASKADSNCMNSIYALQSLIKQENFKSASIWTITSGVHPLEEIRELALQQAPVWGLIRVMATEHPEIKFRSVDISPEPSGIELKNLARFITNPDDEDEFVLRDSYRFVHRMVRKEYKVLQGEEVPYCLVKGRQGTMADLNFVEKPRKIPGAGEVEIKIYATGINVKDVLKTSGVFEHLSTYDSNLIAKLGFECSGVIVTVGEGVTGFKIGDEVMGIANNSFANYTTARNETLIHKPGHLSFEEAASMPVSYLTAHYALVILARIKAGDRVLIHTATGGVGLAAINIARKAGAQIFATAGSVEKRDFLQALGIQYVGDSRSLRFAEEIMCLSNNEGIDIVLNTLSGKAIRKSMSILKPVTGQFIDISNIYNESLKVHFPERGISLHTFDLERMNELSLSIIWKELREHLQNGSYPPVPFRTYPMAEISRAFKNVSKGLNIGKSVVSFEEPELVITANSGKIPVSKDGSYLVTGGLRGFGLATAKWLVECGAENLILVSRSGASNDEARDALAAFVQQGVRVAVECADVSNEAQMADLMKRIRQDLPPLKGIIHAAMVLDDATIVNMDEKRMKQVCDPKIRGAWNLHTCSQDMHLDFFICYSSISTAIGNAGQGNYAAANYFLESLARYRKILGLPALTVSWGPMSDVGYVARNSDIRNYLLKLGMNEVGLESAWQAICLGLREKDPVLGVYQADWNTVAKYNRQIADSPKFSKLAGKNSVKHGTEDSDLEKLLAMPPEERELELVRILSREISRFLGLELPKISMEEPISGLGIDSFTVVELILRIEKVFSLRLQKMVFFKPGLTIKGLAEIVEKEMTTEKAKEKV